MRMYPEDIVKVFGEVPVGTKVTVVNQTILLGWAGKTLYLEANPTKTQSNQIEIAGQFTPKPLNDKLKKTITTYAGASADSIDWKLVEKTVLERQGLPVAIATSDAKKKTQAPHPHHAEMKVKTRYNYN